VPANFAYSGYLEPTAGAEMVDTVTFDIPGATATTVTPISFSYLLDGTFTSGGDSADNVLTELVFGNANFEVEWDGSQGPYVTSGTTLAGLTVTCFTTSCFGVQVRFTCRVRIPPRFSFWTRDSSAGDRTAARRTTATPGPSACRCLQESHSLRIRACFSLRRLPLLRNRPRARS
jgi:hypothetical protein